MPTILVARCCPHCAKRVIAVQRVPNHILHLLLCIPTCGAWAIVWLFVCLCGPATEPPVCMTCAMPTDPLPQPLTASQKIAAARNAARQAEHRPA